jgi:putative peptidoglycan lipid II flippase
MLPPPVAATSLAAHQVAASSPPVPVPPPRRRRRGVWAAVLLVVLLAGGAVALLAVLASQRESATGSTAEPTTEPAAGPVTLAAAQDFDPPPGSGEEHHPEVGLAIDGNPDTVWTSERYNQQFPSLKPGVGIWVDLGSAQHVTSVAVLSPSKGWKAEVRVADAPTAPASLDGFAKAGDVSDAAPRVPVDARARRVLIWIVQLPTSELRMSIGEVQVFTG